MKRDGRFRVFSVKRLVLSIVLGFLVLASYVFVLFLIDRAGKTPPNVMLAVIGWPRWLWVLWGGQFSDDDMAAGLTFFAICNTALFAAISYVVLAALSLVSPKPTVTDPPPLPKPEQFHSSPAPTD